MNTVLVTGSTGFVGQHLVKDLVDHNIRVVGVGNQRDIKKPSLPMQNYYAINLMDEAATATIDFTTIDSVIHLAGLAMPAASFDNPSKYITTNIGIEINLFETALKQGVKPKFLIISSGALYDPKAPLPLDESSSVVPSSPYAVSKLGQEQMAQYYGIRGFEVIIARPFNHIGPGQNPGFIVPDLTQQVIAMERGEANGVLVGNLDAKRDYTDVRDIVRAYRLLLKDGRPGETYNICSGTTRSGHEVLDHIIKAAGASPKITEDPSKMRPSDTPELYGSHQKLTTDTGWQPEISFEATIQDVVADWRQRTPS
jgi:GDP-4-dehydro-6-deoxy-D-mannose reductase